MGTDINFQNGTVVTPDWLNEVNALKETDYPELLQQVNAHKADTDPHPVLLQNVKTASLSAWEGATAYYFNPTGSDENDGLSNETPFQHIQHLINMLGTGKLSPRSSIHLYLSDGDYSEEGALIFPPHFGGMYIHGNTTNPENVIVSAIQLLENLASLGIEGLTCTTTTRTAIDLPFCRLYTVNKVIIENASTNIGIFINGSTHGEIANCTISNRGSAIYVSGGSCYSNTNGGTGNTIGLNAVYSNGHIKKYSIQPAGTTTEATAKGGVIN